MFTHSRQGRGRPGRPTTTPIPQRQSYDIVQRLIVPLMESRSKLWGPADINPQQASLFYNGRIPQEVTDLIFEFALSPETIPFPESVLDPGRDLQVRHDHEQSQDDLALEPQAQENKSAGTSRAVLDSVTEAVARVIDSLAIAQHNALNSIVRESKSGFDWFRPGDTGKRVFRGHALLRTCRCVYLDAHRFIEQARDMTVYDNRPPPGRVSRNASMLKPWWSQDYRYVKIHSIRWLVQMYRLEEMARSLHPSAHATTNDDPYSRGLLIDLLSHGGAPADPIWRTVHNLEHFHMVLRRTDWDRWEDNKALAINPYRRSGAAPSPELMRRDMHATMVEGETQPAPDERAWAVLFRAMRSLRTLTISFETSEDKRDEMEEIVAWARTWRFDIMSWRHWVGDRRHDRAACLVAEDKPAEKMSWRGMKHHWSNFCTACGSEEIRPECTFCVRKLALIKQDKGPRLLIWTLTWKPVPVDVSADGEGSGPHTT